MKKEELEEEEEEEDWDSPTVIRSDSNSED